MHSLRYTRSHPVTRAGVGISLCTCFPHVFCRQPHPPTTYSLPLENFIQINGKRIELEKSEEDFGYWAKTPVARVDCINYIAKKSKELWKPERGKNYSSINGYGKSVCDVWEDDIIDEDRLEIGNVYHTREEAQKQVDKLKAITRVNREIDRLNDNRWKPVWNDEGNKSYHVSFYCGRGRFEICQSSVYKDCFVLKQIQSRVKAEQLIESHENDLLIIFEVE